MQLRWVLARRGSGSNDERRPGEHSMGLEHCPALIHHPLRAFHSSLAFRWTRRGGGPRRRSYCITYPMPFLRPPLFFIDPRMIKTKYTPPTWAISFETYSSRILPVTTKDDGKPRRRRGCAA